MHFILHAMVGTGYVTKAHKLLLGFGLSGVLVVTITCSSPVNPISTQRDYVVYIEDGGFESRFLAWHIPSNDIDTLLLPYVSRSAFTCSADGKRLYLSDRDSTAVVDAASGSLIRWLHYSVNSIQGVVSSYDGTQLAITGADLNVLNAKTYAVLFHDTSSTGVGEFSRDGRYFVCGYQNSGEQGVQWLDLQTNEIRRMTMPFDGVLRKLSLMSQSGDTCALYYLVGYDLFRLLVVEREAPFFLLDTLNSPGSGDIQGTGYGGELFVSNCGEINSTVPGLSSIEAINFKTPARNRIISTSGAKDGNIPLRLPIGHFCVTPDNILIAGAAASYGGGEILLYDPDRDSILAYFDLGISQIYNMTCQMR